MNNKLVRGNIIYICNNIPWYAGVYQPQVGDSLTVCRKSKNGWIRVKNHRTNNITNLRNGYWLSKCPPKINEKIPITPYTAPTPIPFHLNKLCDQDQISSSSEVQETSPLDQIIRKSQIDQLENDLKILRLENRNLRNIIETLMKK